MIDAERDETERSDDQDRPQPRDNRRLRALAVVVDGRGLEYALRTFKKLVLKEGLLKDLRKRERYEKPGSRRRRKTREAIRRRRRQEARAQRGGGPVNR
jgi:small subunit ribosomal protein S21